YSILNINPTLFCVFYSDVRPHSFSFFFFNDPAPTEIYTLSLHDALPISFRVCRSCDGTWRRWHCVGRKGGIRAYPGVRLAGCDPVSLPGRSSLTLSTLTAFHKPSRPLHWVIEATTGPMQATLPSVRQSTPRIPGSVQQNLVEQNSGEQVNRKDSVTGQEKMGRAYESRPRSVDARIR